MVISRRAAVGSIVTGSAMLCLALIAGICGVIHFHMLSVHDVYDSVGLWSLFVSFIYSLCAVTNGCERICQREGFI